MSKAILLPYSRIVGQEPLKLALEIAYIARLNGVLIRGQRGTGKSTAARSFAQMVFNDLPVTLPINATEDRVVGGLDLDDLLQGKRTPRPGLLQQANNNLLFVDEVNLLEDHIVNIILDVTSTRVLTIQQNDIDERGIDVQFMLVGTMNPDEGELRPQLLDRFGLAVHLMGETKIELRREIVNIVVAFDLAKEKMRAGGTDEWYNDGIAEDETTKMQLEAARKVFDRVTISDALKDKCLDLAVLFGVHGHRADIELPIAARAAAARDYVKNAGANANEPVEATAEHVRSVAPLVLMHRRQDKKVVIWDKDVDGKSVDKVLNPQ